MTQVHDLVIVGGGISGLSCAYYTQKEYQSKNLPFSFKLIESNNSFGGVIQTLKHENFTIEKGPDAFLSEKEDVIDLIKDLNLEDKIIPTNSDHRRSFIASREELISLPQGFYLTVPTKYTSFLKSPLMSLKGKLRVLSEKLVYPRKHQVDEDISSFIKRRFGEELLQRIAQPMVGGIYAGDPKYLSARFALSKFWDYEKKYGSVLKGLKLELKQKLKSTSGPRYSLFLSLKDGVSSLINRLVEVLPADSLMNSTSVSDLQYDQEKKQWKIRLDNDDEILSKSVCLATPASATAKICDSISPELSSEVRKISHESVLVMNLAYKRNQIKHPLNGFGFVAPCDLDLPFIACSFSSVKFPTRSPEDSVLLRLFVGGAFGRKYLNFPPEELWSLLDQSLRKYLGVNGNPLFRDTSHYMDLMPQYGVGHKALIDSIEIEAEQIPKFYLTGNIYQGVGIPDCIKRSKLVSKKVIEGLKND